MVAGHINVATDALEDSWKPVATESTCGSFRGMRLAGAFFANRADVVDDMLNVEGGF